MVVSGSGSGSLPWLLVCLCRKVRSAGILRDTNSHLQPSLIRPFGLSGTWAQCGDGF